MPFDAIGRWLLFFGIVLVLVGGLFLLLGRVPWLGRLPGDIRIEGKEWSCFFPLATSILLSLLLTLVLNIVARLLNR